MKTTSRPAKEHEQENFNVGMQIMSVLAPNGTVGLSKHLLDRFTKASELAMHSRKMYRIKSVTKLSEAKNQIQKDIEFMKAFISFEMSNKQWLFRDHDKIREYRNAIKIAEAKVAAYQNAISIINQ
jgi:hypothetical protein